MSSGVTTTTASSADQGGGTGITALHSDIIQTHILTRLDGPTLASTTCSSSELQSLCTEEKLWKTICNNTWPSTTEPLVRDTISTFSSGHRSFFSDAYPALNHPKSHHRKSSSSRRRPVAVETPLEFISAVDIHYGNQLVYSKVLVTETLTGWFMCSPFRIDLLDTKESIPTPVKFDSDEAACVARIEENMRLSWIVIDPIKRRAVNVSSFRPVLVRRHWLTGDIQVKYATVMEAAGGRGELVQCMVVVTCGGEEGGELHVREVSMQVKDMEGKNLTGKDSLEVMVEAMEMQRKKGREGEEKERYEMFSELKRAWREEKQMRERRLDMICIAAGVSFFVSMCYLVIRRYTY